MKALLQDQPLDDEGLLTLLCEVESIISGRPLTKLSDDPRDPEALTPNHLLLLVVKSIKLHLTAFIIHEPIDVS